MRTLVTGAAGFIGSTLVDRLIADGHDVVGIDNFSNGARVNVAHSQVRSASRGGCFTFIEADVEDPEFIDIVAESDASVAFHLAAHIDLRASVDQPQADARCNVLGTINVLEACRRGGVSRVVYAASGGSRYGAPDALPVLETSALAPMSPYAAAKISGELYLQAYAAMYGMTPFALGLANVYGPRQDPLGEAGVVAIFASAMIAGRPTAIFGDGSAKRDYVYVGDVVDAFMRAAQAPTEFAGFYNIGTGKQTTVNELHHLIAQATGSSAAASSAPARPGEVAAIALDTSKAANELGWTPAVTLTEGVRQTVAWLRDAEFSAERRELRVPATAQ